MGSDESRFKVSLTVRDKIIMTLIPPPHPHPPNVGMGPPLPPPPRAWAVSQHTDTSKNTKAALKCCYILHSSCRCNNFTWRHKIQHWLIASVSVLWHSPHPCKGRWVAACVCVLGGGGGGAQSHASETNVKLGPTLRASLSGTLLQTLPDLVTPLKGHSLSLHSCPAMRSSLSERFGY